MSETPKRIGRPRGRKPLLNLRVEQPLLDQLRAAAATAERTVSEETVIRLRASFADAEPALVAIERLALTEIVELPSFRADEAGDIARRALESRKNSRTA